MMKKLIYIFAMLFLLTSCEFDFDIKGLDGETKLYLECFPSNLDIFTISVRKAYPSQYAVTQDNLDPSVEKMIENGKLHFYVNDEEQELSYVIGSTTSACASITLNPGDEARIECRDDGIDPISASCVVPEPFPSIFTLTNEKKDNRDYIIIRYKAPESSKERYYSVALWSHPVITRFTDSTRTEIKTIIDTAGWYGVSLYTDFRYDTQWDTAGMKDLLPGLPSQMSGINIGNNEFTAFWKDSDAVPENDRMKMVRVESKNLIRSFDYEGIELVSVGWKDVFPVKCYDRLEMQYKALLGSIDEDNFLYMRSKYDKMMNVSGEAGLAPTTFLHFNVKGGFGIVGGAHYTEAELVLPE
ncbi:MAG: DUF4249 family protein [Bacteroidales bacterium]|nr:DUF4249 family protein [Bacteroidales bacterium]